MRNKYYIEKEKLALKGTKKRLFAVISFLLISSILMVSAAFAWFTLSNAPEVVGVETTISGNGSLEIALMPGTGLTEDITGGLSNSSAAYAGGKRAATSANITWGNIVNLEDAAYGLDLVTMRPAKLNVEGSESTEIGDVILKSPIWGEDGRINQLRDTSPRSHYIDFDYNVDEGFDGELYGVRAIIDEDGDTYGFVVDLAFRLNTTDADGNPGKLLLQTEGAQRIYADSYLESTQGGGSNICFLDEDGNEVDGSSTEQSSDYLKALKVAFVKDLGDSTINENEILAYAKADVLTGDLYLCDYNGDTIEEPDSDIIFDGLEKNVIYQISAVVWLDGESITNSSMSLDPSIFSKVKLNLQFSTNIDLIPVENSDAKNKEKEPGTVNEPGNIVVDNGECGDNLTWELYDNGALVISGSGDMYDCSNNTYGVFGSTPEVSNNVSKTKSIIIDEGVTSVGNSAFTHFNNVNYISLSDSLASIESNAFSSCENLKSINIPASVTDISDDAFTNDVALKEILVSPDNATYKDIRGVLYSKNGKELYICPENHYIKQFYIANGTEKISRYAFYNNTVISELYIPQSLTKVELNAFNGCVNIDSVYYNGNITDWNTIVFDEGNENITNSTIYCLDGTLNSSSLSGCDDISTSILYSDSNNIIYSDGKLFTKSNNPSSALTGDNAQYKTNVKKAVVADGVSELSDSAFSGFTSLTDTMLPLSVKSIGQSAFYNCSSLDNIEISSGVTTIMYNAFAKCSSLSDVYIDDLSAWLDIEFKQYITKTAFLQSDAINYGIGIANPLMNSASLYLKNELVTNLVIPDGTTTISIAAFDGCSSIRSVTIPSSVACIGYNAFADCDNLSAVYIEDLTAWINMEYISVEFHNILSDDIDSGIGAANPLMNSANLYLNNRLVTSLIIPKGITAIKPEIFENCTSIKSVTLSRGVREAEFINCQALESITVSETVSSLSFTGCDSISSVYINDIKAWCSIPFSINDDKCTNPLSNNADLYFNGELVIDLELPSNMSDINKCAFYGCRSLESVYIPSNISSIRSNAFAGCQNISRVYSDNLNSWLSISFENEGANPLCSGADLYCNNEIVKNLVIPNDCSVIKAYSFYGCSSLESVVIQTELSRIRESAFGNCTNLNDVYIDDLTAWCNIIFENASSNPLWFKAKLYLDGELVKDLVIPSGITSIKNFAFTNCSSIESLTIPNGVTSIGSHAFGSLLGGSSLKSVTIPSSVNTIGDCAFQLCKNISAVYIEDLSAWCAINFNHQEKAFELFSHGTNPLMSSADLYVNNELVTDLVIPDGVPKISDYCFNGCKSITTVHIPNSVTSIGSYVFDNCDNVVYVQFDGTMEQWKVMRSHGLLNVDFSTITVHCSDGDVTPT